MIQWQRPVLTVGNRTVLKSINGDFHIIRYDDIKEEQKDRYKLLERIGSILRSVGTYQNANEAKETANAIMNYFGTGSASEFSDLLDCYTS